MSQPTPPAPSGPTAETDGELLHRIRRGEEEALQQLHRRYAPLVFHLACRSLDRAAAEEIVQDTFLTVWRKAADFDEGRGSFRTWLLSISRHRMLDELRRRSRRPQEVLEASVLDQVTLSAEDPLPDETLWLQYQRHAVSEALAALPEPQRAALRLAFFADLTHEEVAKALKVPLGTAKTRIRSGLRLLERHLGGLVAVLLVAFAGGSWLYHRHRSDDALTDRALHLLADSQTKALRLTPPTVPQPLGQPQESGLHATFRSAPGATLAVLTLTHFPAPPPGERHVLWLRTPQGWQHLDLLPTNATGSALQVLEAPWLGTAWPLELRITRESRPAALPSDSLVVSWSAAGQAAP